MKSFKDFLKEANVSIGPYVTAGAASMQIDIENPQEKERYLYSVYKLLEHARRVQGPNVTMESGDLYHISPEVPFMQNQTITISRALEDNITKALERYMSDEFRWVLSFYTSDESQIKYNVETGSTINTVTQPRVNGIMIINKGKLIGVIQETPGFAEFLNMLRAGSGRGTGQTRKQINFGGIVFKARNSYVKQFISDGSAAGDRATLLWEDELKSTRMYGRLAILAGLIGRTAYKLLGAGFKK